MEHKFEYKDESERKSILEANNSYYLIEEQNITEGNFLIFSDVQPQQVDVKQQETNYRISDISQYLSSNEATISDVEDLILQSEENKIINGGI
jgi:hypothetical protein